MCEGLPGMLATQGLNCTSHKGLWGRQATLSLQWNSSRKLPSSQCIFFHFQQHSIGHICPLGVLCWCFQQSSVLLLKSPLFMKTSISALALVSLPALTIAAKATHLLSHPCSSFLGNTAWWWHWCSFSHWGTLCCSALWFLDNLALLGSCTPMVAFLSTSH